MEEICLNCKFWKTASNNYWNLDNWSEGHCHLYPPTVMYFNDKLMSKYPSVAGGDECGQFKEKDM